MAHVGQELALGDAGALGGDACLAQLLLVPAALFDVLLDGAGHLVEGGGELHGFMRAGAVDTGRVVTGCDCLGGARQA
jgi:hypothetical protein